MKRDRESVLEIEEMLNSGEKSGGTMLTLASNYAKFHLKLDPSKLEDPRD